ncbi:MAG: Rieske [2Fe-2S] iron-sulfur protein [Gemmatimonadetes bacterium]|nr:Rieske [2Fe-2S] iron-sulfur protein [Gemmatimonadota bacterium]
MTDIKPRATVDECAGCSLGSRRDFVVGALRAGAMAMAALGLSPGGAEAMPLRFVTALVARGEERSYPVPPSDGAQIDKDNDVILVRTGKAVYAFALSCPHQNTALRWDAAENRFQCPKHKSRYHPDGTFIEGRATRGMDRYAVKLVGAAVVVDLDKLYQEDTELSQWQHAVVTLA